MKRGFGILLLSFILLGLPVAASAQMKIYTRSYRIQDFNIRTTKIVLDGSPALISAIREEVTSLWTASPYEFCTAADYEKSKVDPSSYFLRPVTSRGIISLVLTKGGKEGDSNTLRTPMTLVSVPVAGENYEGSLQYMAAFISIIQDYIISAVGSERIAYLGINSIRSHRPAGMKVVKDPQEASRAFREGDPSVAVEIIITPDGNNSSRPRIRYVVGTTEYELYSFSQ